MPCAGGGGTCGGGWAINIYAIGAATTTSTSTSTTSPTNSPTPSPTSAGTTPTLSPANINSATYQRLTQILPQVLQNSISISSQSWELGVLVNSLTEVYYTWLSPFSYNPSGSSSPPWLVLDTVTSALSGYSWSGAPTSQRANLAAYLLPSTSPVGLDPGPLMNGDGALGDPCSLGAGVWAAANYVNEASAVYGSVKGVEYAWAIGNQYQHLLQGSTNSQGTLSQREGYFELWSDMGYMIPPFLGCESSLATLRQTLG